MKKIISLVCVMVMFFNCMIIAQGAEGEENAIKLTIGEKKIVKVENGVENVMETDVAPMIKDGRTFVPVRGIFEIIGAEISWNGDEKAVTVKTTDNEVIVRIDNKQARVNGKRVMMDAPPFIQDGRTLIPLRFISENLGYNVEWDGETQTITITGFGEFAEKSKEIPEEILPDNIVRLSGGATFEFPELPKRLNGNPMFDINKIDVRETSYGVELTLEGVGIFYYSGIPIKNHRGYFVYDDKGYLIESGSFSGPSVGVGQKFRAFKIYIYFDIEPNTNYILKLTDYA